MPTLTEDEVSSSCSQDLVLDRTVNQQLSSVSAVMTCFLRIILTHVQDVSRTSNINLGYAVS